VTDSSSADLDALIRRFEIRAQRLTRAARAFVIVIFILLVFGGVAVYQAPVLTNNDITSNNLENRRASANHDITRLDNRNREIDTILNSIKSGPCSTAYHKLFIDWRDNHRSADRPNGNTLHEVPFTNLPDRIEIITAINNALNTKELAQINVNLGLRIILTACGSSYDLIMNRDGYKAFTSAIANYDFGADRNTANTLMQEEITNREQINLLTRVIDTTYNEQAKEEVLGKAASLSNNPTDDYRLLVVRLVQTSITRFGILAVVSFLVSILLPMYRYNVRLAHFYQARADAVLFLREKVLIGLETSGGFETLERILTPRFEFGKTPSTPVEQVIDLA
jgi:hypothetical protein